MGNRDSLQGVLVMHPEQKKKMHQNDEDGKREHRHTRLKRVREARARFRKYSSVTASHFNAIVLRDSRCRKSAAGASVRIGKNSARMAAQRI